MSEVAPVTWCLLCYLEHHVDVVNNGVSMLLLCSTVIVFMFTPADFQFALLLLRHGCSLKC